MVLELLGKRLSEVINNLNIYPSETVNSKRKSTWARGYKTSLHSIENEISPTSSYQRYQ